MILKEIYIACLVILLGFKAYTQKTIEKTQVLILGTPHLAQVQGFKQGMLGEVKTKLDSMNFDAICIEQMPGELLYDIQSRENKAFDGVIKQFGGKRLSLADSAQKYMDVSFLEAKERVKELLNQKELNEEERQDLIVFLVATTDLASAILQLSYLSKQQVSFTDPTKEYIFQTLKKRLKSHNEIYSLGIPLAMSRGLSVLYPIDNMQDEAILLAEYPGFIQDYQNNMELFKGIGDKPVFQMIARLTSEGVKSGNLAKLYGYMNSEEYKNDDYMAQWAIWLQTEFKSGTDRARYSLWEMRNQEIAANITRVAAQYPGKRILVIIGASHKLFIEKYLETMPDVKILAF